MQKASHVGHYKQVTPPLKGRIGNVVIDPVARQFDEMRHPLFSLFL